MGLNAGDVISASAFIELKARIKAECARRKYNGSVESYSESSYDYTVIPATGNVPLPEHFNKIIVPLNAIINTGRSQESSKDIAYQMATISDSLSTLESISESSASSGCSASCTGLCQGACSTSCSSNCLDNCSGGCATNCVGTCVGGCRGLCKQKCYDNCDTDCYGQCATDCSGTCAGGCKNECKGTCAWANRINPE